MSYNESSFEDIVSGRDMPTLKLSPLHKDLILLLMFNYGGRVPSAKCPDLCQTQGQSEGQTTESMTSAIC